MKRNKIAKTQLIDKWKLAGHLIFKAKRNNRNLLKGIYYYKSCLKILTKNKYPGEWSVIQECLGFAYYSLKPRNKLSNIYLSIDHFMNIFALPPRYRQKQIEQVYIYLAYLLRRLLKYRDSTESKTRRYRNRTRRISELFDVVLKDDKKQKNV